MMIFNYKVIPYLILTYFSVLFGNTVLANSEEEFAFIDPSFVSLYQNTCFTFSSDTSYPVASKDQFGNYQIADPHTEVHIFVNEAMVLDERYGVEKLISNPSHIRLDLKDTSALEGFKQCFEPSSPLKILELKVTQDQYGDQNRFLLGSQNLDEITAVWIPEEFLETLPLHYFVRNFASKRFFDNRSSNSPINFAKQLKKSFEGGALPNKNDILGIRNIDCVESDEKITLFFNKKSYRNTFVPKLLIGLEDEEGGGLHFFIDQDETTADPIDQDRYYTRKDRKSIRNIEEWEKIELLQTLQNFIRDGHFSIDMNLISTRDSMRHSSYLIGEQKIIAPAKEVGLSYTYSLKESLSSQYPSPLKHRSPRSFYTLSPERHRTLNYEIRKLDNYLVIKQQSTKSTIEFVSEYYVDDGDKGESHICYGQI